MEDETVTSMVISEVQFVSICSHLHVGFITLHSWVHKTTSSSFL